MPSNLIIGFGSGKVFSGGALLFEQSPNKWVQKVIRKISYFEPIERIEGMFGERYLESWLNESDRLQYMNDDYEQIIELVKRINHKHAFDGVRYEAVVDVKGWVWRLKGYSSIDGSVLPPEMGLRYGDMERIMMLLMTFASDVLRSIEDRKYYTPYTTHNITEAREGPPDAAAEDDDRLADHPVPNLVSPPL